MRLRGRRRYHWSLVSFLFPSPPILLKRLPGGGGGGGGGAGASKALPKCEPELMLPLLHPNSARKMGMGMSILCAVHE